MRRFGGLHKWLWQAIRPRHQPRTKGEFSKRSTALRFFD
jgi:hypothetical protein